MGNELEDNRSFAEGVREKVDLFLCLAVAAVIVIAILCFVYGW